MVHWLQHETGGLLTLCAASIAVLLFLIIKVKLEPFIALLVSGLALALVAGLSVEEIVGTALSSKESVLEKGFGGLLGHIAPIVGLGTILGAILERSGGADVLTRRLLSVAGERGAPLAMGVAGLIFGTPVFFDVGIFVLAPLVYVTAKQGGRSLVLYTMPLLAGLSMTHAFLPPHPGPVAAAGLLEVPLGWLIIFGLICGIPAFLVAGVAWGAWIGKRVFIEVPEEYIVAEQEKAAKEEPEPEPSLALVGFIIAVPLVLILLATFGTVWWEDSPALPTLTFLGNPVVALTIAVLLAMYTLGIRRGISTAELSDLAAKALRPIGMILLVIGAGAFFGAVISATGVGKALATTLSDAGLPVILLAYLIACGLRIAQGSATVAIVTTGGIVAPLVQAENYSDQRIALIAIAISAGSIIASHVNDGGFWIISRYFNMSVRDTIKTWTVLETILSIVGFAMAASLSVFI
ncbi:GntP family gluconate:H+ symporter [Actinomadura pelletieri DSM 43383]|uniref:GntP family gluconate:H+ symporter n=1 Tax=Actinomadura pelletieri DSM 43383 TaxID=1120940 RepID=A0A495QY26_9ACTN|nr:gluconate:H+ symporter [Actinomadura pelletieri]RKS79091.1 GntP family gluconate:H+ symporter [Actinomadura pelletieri DSM 43383]